MKTQWPEILYHAIILECEGSPTTVGMYVTEQASLDRLEAERRKFDPRCPDPVWLYVLTVRGGEVIARRDLSLENPIAEVHAAM